MSFEFGCPEITIILLNPIISIHLVSNSLPLFLCLISRSGQLVYAKMSLLNNYTLLSLKDLGYPHIDDTLLLFLVKAGLDPEN